MAHFRLQCFVPCKTVTRVVIDELYGSGGIRCWCCDTVGAALFFLLVLVSDNGVSPPPISLESLTKQPHAHIVRWQIHLTVSGFHFLQAASSELGKVCVCVKRMSGRLGERGEVEKTCPRDRGSESTLVRVICRKQAQSPHAGPHLPGFLSLWPMLDFFYVCYVSVKWCLKSHSLQTLLASVAGSSVMSPSCQGPLSLSSCLVVLRGQPVWHIILHLSNVSSSAACHYLNCVLNWPLWGRWLFLFY